MKKIVITGGCGFVGASIALRLRRDALAEQIVCLDNLKRRGSELNVPRLKAAGVEFVHGDIRVREDLDALGNFDLMIEASAEPSVLAGFGESPAYLVQTNLLGTCNCLERVREQGADLCFLSTSRVYPHGLVNSLHFQQRATRFEISDEQSIPGAGAKGISEAFPLTGARSLYGATKLASEILIQEYVSMYGIRAVVNRCGLLTGPWQFGKVDQGVVVLWVARHFWRQPLAYIGYGGTGRQVRDLLHIDDLYRLLRLQFLNLGLHSGQVYNVGGGKQISLSLVEMTDVCRRMTGNRIEIEAVSTDRPADVRAYISDCRKVTAVTGWKPKKNAEEIIEDIYRWIFDNEGLLAGVLK